MIQNRGIVARHKERRSCGSEFIWGRWGFWKYVVVMGCGLGWVSHALHVPMARFPEQAS